MSGRPGPGGLLNTLRPLALCVLGAFSLAAAGDLEGPNVRRLGRTVMQWRDGAVQVVVGYRHAQVHLDRKWIVLDTCVTSTSNRPVEIWREDVALAMPDGTRRQMPSQHRMAQGIPDLRRVLHEAKISRDPLDGYFPFSSYEERLGFFAVPGEDIVFDKVTVNHLTRACGPVFFEAPKDRWEPGIYTFSVENRDVHVRLPLTLGIEGPLERER